MSPLRFSIRVRLAVLLTLLLGLGAFAFSLRLLRHDFALLAAPTSPALAESAFFANPVLQPTGYPLVPDCARHSHSA